jgi:hypothetical protein
MRTMTWPAKAPVVAPAPGPGPGPEQEGPLRELREYLAASRQHLDQIAKAIRDNGRPGVLETATITIPAAGYVDRSYRVPYAAVSVTNQSLFGPVTVTSAGPQNSAPGGGQGQMLVPPGGVLSQNISGQAITFYGPAGTVITYSVLVNRIQPSAGQLPLADGTMWTNVSGTTGQAIGASGASPQIATAGAGNLGLMVAVTAAPTGTTPTLTVAVAGLDAAGNPYGIGATAALNAIGNTAIAVGVGTNNGFVVPALVQVTWTIGGTGGPNFPNVDITLIGRQR